MTNVRRLKSGINVYSDPYGVTLQHFSKDGDFTLHLKLTPVQATELRSAIDAALDSHRELA